MIEISRTDVYGFEAAIRGMRNPMNSWEKSDSTVAFHMVENFAPGDPMEKYYYEWNEKYGMNIKIGPNDLALMTKLAKAGTEHSKYRRMIIVTCDILAPLYWWKEYDTYKVGTVANSCSTMHKIAAKEFEFDDFSNEHLFDAYGGPGEPDIIDSINVVINGTPVLESPQGFLVTICVVLNHYRKLYLETKDKKYWWQMIQLLPSSYNQKRTVMLNYEVLAKIYRERKNHKLDEWHDFCDWIKTLPYAKEVITLEA